MSTLIKDKLEQAIGKYVTLVEKKPVKLAVPHKGYFNDGNTVTIGNDNMYMGEEPLDSASIKQELQKWEGAIINYLSEIKNADIPDERKLYQYLFIAAGLNSTRSFLQMMSKRSLFGREQLLKIEKGASVAKLDEDLRQLDTALYNRKLRFNETVRDFHRQQAKKKKDDVPFFEGMILKDNQVKPLFDELINRKWLDIRTDYADFLYYFKGQGTKPFEKMIWRGKKTVLCLFLKEFEYEPEWTVAEAVFEDVSANSLKTMASNTYQQNNTANKYWEYKKEIEKIHANLKEI